MSEKKPNPDSPTYKIAHNSWIPANQPMARIVECLVYGVPNINLLTPRKTSYQDPAENNLPLNDSSDIKKFVIHFLTHKEKFKKSAQLMIEVDEAKKAGQIIHQIELLKEIILYEIYQAEAYIRLGMIYYKRMDWEKTIEMFENAKSENGKVNYFEYGDALKESGKYTEAYAILKQCLTPEPDLRVLLAISETCNTIGQYEEGLCYCEEFLKYQPNNSDILRIKSSLQQAIQQNFK